MIEKINIENPKFMGKEKYVYELIDTLKIRYVDRLVLMNRRDDEVIQRAIDLFNAINRRLVLKLNGEIIHKFGIALKRILDTENGAIFDSLKDMAEFHGYSIYEANKELKTKFRFKWVD